MTDLNLIREAIEARANMDRFHSPVALENVAATISQCLEGLG